MATTPKPPAGFQGPWKRAPKLNTNIWQVGKVGKGPLRGQFVAKRKGAAAAPAAPAAPSASTGGKSPLWNAKPKDLSPERIEALWGPGASLVRAGGGKWTIRLANGGRAGAPNTAAPADPYAGHPDADLLRQFEGQEWAQNAIRQMRSDQTRHEQWVGNTVMPWQSGALTGLANINKAAQDQFTGQQQAAAQGMAQAGGATPGMVQGVSGGAVAGPNAFQQAATAQAMATQASTMGQVAQWQGLMGTLGPTTFSQGQVAALSDYAKGLPVLYAQKRQERVDAMNQYIAEQQLEQQKLALQLAQFEEEQRANRVGESISATNAQTNAAIAFANLGLDAAQEARLGMPDPVAPPPGQVPPGFVVVPDADGGWSVERDPSYVGPDAGPGAGPSSPSNPGGRAPSPSRGEFNPNNLAKQGFVGGWRTRPTKAVLDKMRKSGRASGTPVQATDGTWWIKGKTPPRSRGSSGPSPRNQGTLTNELTGLFRGTADRDGWEDLGPTEARNQVSLWVRKNKPSFAGENRKVNHALLLSVLRTVIGGPRNGVADQVIKHLKRGYMVQRDDGWYWK